MNKDTLSLAGGSLLIGVFAILFLFGPLRVAEGLYRVGLWPRATTDDVYQELTISRHINLTGCSAGVNGWDYVCEIAPDATQKKFYDRIAVVGGVFGIAWYAEIRPGPLPDREAYEAKGRAQVDHAQADQR